MTKYCVYTQFLNKILSFFGRDYPFLALFKENYFKQRSILSRSCIPVSHNKIAQSCPITKWSVIRMPFEYRIKFCPVFRPPFEFRTGIKMMVWIPNYHLNAGHLNTIHVTLRYSDVSVIQMFVIQIHTVVQWRLLVRYESNIFLPCIIFA